MAEKTNKKEQRPGFLESLSQAYTLRRENIIILTGDVNGLFYSREEDNYISLEQILNSELKDKFNLVRMDIAGGITFYDRDTAEEVTRVCESTDGYYTPAGRVDALKRMIGSSMHNPLQALVLLQGMGEAFVRVRRLEPHIKPMCLVFQFAGALFSAGDYSRLSELERQRLISFLSWVSGPLFRESPELFILVNSVKSELNAKITALPHAEHIEIDLPGKEDRRKFVQHFTGRNKGIRFSHGKGTFVEDTAGLALHNIKDLLEVAARTKETLTRKHVVKEVNDILQAQLGDIIRIKYPAHTSKDIVGFKETGEIFTTIFERCEDQETAVAAILVSGPNGSGKTFQLEAYAAESGRVVIELAGIRGSYFGETDRFFELLRWHIATFGKILILVDEAHTAFGSVHSGQTHQTEQRLSGNIIKMMGDPRYFGKVLWGLMTSRPDELDPDIKSRAPVQVPIFDLEGEERKQFVLEMFKRKKISLSEADVNKALSLTTYYSARDYRNLVAEVLAQRRKKPEITVLEVLTGWQASKSIKRQREFQEMIAALHCSYPNLLPEKYRDLPDNVLMRKVEELKILLHQ
ncbi:MAG: AAA family ATPase [Candidatus Aminicenantes bacterium]|nr:AAA family ATPase [Candidatus Aminicenantes bacterium]